MNPKISIIVTSYNIESFIGECLENIVNQTIKDIEIIVVDDGSSDKTTDIIKDYAAKDSRIIPVLNSQNSPGGVATPANIGMDLAKGDFIGFADGDDLYEPSMFEKLYDSALKNNADIVLCNFQEFESESGLKNDPYEPSWRNVAVNGSMDISTPHNKKKILELLPVPWRKIYSRRMLDAKSIRFPVGPFFFEDNGFHWMTTLNSNKVAFVDEILCLHRRNRVGQTMSSGGERLLGVFHQHSVIYKYLSEENILNDYREYSLNWLCGHVSWIQQVLAPNYAKEFYEVLIPHFEKYSKNEVQEYFLNRFYDRKSIELIIAVISKDQKKFIKVMNGAFSKTINEKVKFNYHKLGFRRFTSMSFRHLKYKVGAYTHKTAKNKGDNSPASVQANILNKLDLISHQLHEVNARLDHFEVSNNKLLKEIHHGFHKNEHNLKNVEKIVETGFILVERNSK
ncbi:glycosyltransferase family 2 protein [Pantoea agglomerans]